MPIMDGLQATRAIRLAEQQGERSGHQRIVGLTGNARVEQKQAALDAGMETVVTKPYKCVFFFFPDEPPRRSSRR